MNMINVRRLTVIAFLGAGLLPGISAQESSVQDNVRSEVNLPAQWDLQSCIDYALQQNITIRKNRVNAESTQIDVKTAKAALFPSLSFSTSQNMVNRPYQESSKTVSGSEVIETTSKTSYNGNYGLNASWTIYNGSKRLNTIKQERLNNQVANLDVETSENSIQESIAQIYIQILYAAESVKVNENTLQVSIAQRDRGQELLNAGSIAKSDFAQLEAQVSTDRYQLVTAQATLQDYKLQLKQLLELDGENEMNIYLPVQSDENVLLPLPAKKDVYMSALTLRPEIEASKINVEASELGIDIAKAGYLPTISLSAGIGTNHTSGSDFTFGEQETLYKTIEGLWLDANSAQQRYAAANEKLKSTQISYDLISEQFDLGMKNTVELLTEKNNLLQAQQEQLQAKYMAILNTQLLKFYQGDKLAL